MTAWPYLWQWAWRKAVLGFAAVLISMTSPRQCTGQPPVPCAPSPSSVTPNLTLPSTMPCTETT